MPSPHKDVQSIPTQRPRFLPYAGAREASLVCDNRTEQRPNTTGATPLNLFACPDRRPDARKHDLARPIKNRHLDQLIPTLRLRMAKLNKQAFGKSSKKIERKIEQLELALEDLLIASAESRTTPAADGDEADAALAVTTSDVDAGKPRRRPRVSATTPRERRELDPGSCCPDCDDDLRLVGEDMSEILDLVVAQLKVLQIARLKKSCRRCESSRANAIRPREPENGAGACAQPSHPGQHGERGPAGEDPRVQVR